LKFTWWDSGSWNTICDVCGFKYKAEQLQKRWDGLMVCKDDWEVRHPQELLHPIVDQNKLPWTRPESTDQFINVNFANTDSCSIMGQLGQAGYGTANCAIVGNINGALVP
jgi:hypothetical protein